MREVENMASIAPFIVMNYLKRKEKEEKERKERYQETVRQLAESCIDIKPNKYKVKMSEYNDLPEDVKDLIAYGIIELEN